MANAYGNTGGASGNPFESIRLMLCLSLRRWPGMFRRHEFNRRFPHHRGGSWFLFTNGRN